MKKVIDRISSAVKNMPKNPGRSSIGFAAFVMTLLMSISVPAFIHHSGKVNAQREIRRAEITQTNGTITEIVTLAGEEYSRVQEMRTVVDVKFLDGGVTKTATLPLSADAVVTTGSTIKVWIENGEPTVIKPSAYEAYNAAVPLVLLGMLALPIISILAVLFSMVLQSIDEERRYNATTRRVYSW